jgi:hypothetical protein
MQIPITPQGSYAEPQRFSWDMWYPLPPFHEQYSNEPGLLIHLSPADAGNAEAVIGGAVAGVMNAFPGVGQALSAFAGVVASVLELLRQQPRREP